MTELPDTIPERFDAALLDSLKTELCLNDEFMLLIKDCVNQEIDQNINYIDQSEKLLNEANSIANKMSL